MPITESYSYLTRHIVPGPQNLAYFLPPILLPISLSIPRTVLSRWQNIALFMPLIIMSSLQAWSAMEGVDVISLNSLLWATFLIVLEDPWQHFRLVTGPPAASSADGDGVILQEKSYPMDLGERLIWIGKLLPAIRLDHWKTSRASHDRLQPPPPGFESARSFLAHSALSLVRGFLILDATRAYVEHDPYFFDPEVSIMSPLPFRTLRSLPPWLFRSMIAGAQAYALIGEMFYLPAVVPVIFSSVGLLPPQYSPHTWPAYFGSVSVILTHGVRGLWGGFWHQSMRWSTSGPGYALSDALNLRAGGLLRYAVISLSAFGLSGVVHSGLVPPEPKYVRDSVHHVRLSMAAFFWVQWIAVVLEALTGRLVTSMSGPWKRGRRRVIRMTVNALWTMIWIALTLPLLMDAARQLGYWQMPPLPVSIWTVLRGRGLWTWT